MVAFRACAALMVAVSTLPSTVENRTTSLAGLVCPRRIGPNAMAPENRTVALDV